MRDVYDFAKYFIKNGADSHPSTYDGNMKLQKLLTFANAISIAEHGKPLFNDKILAFTNGCVVEKVRLRYRNEYNSFKRESDLFQPDFSEQEYNVFNKNRDSVYRVLDRAKNIESLKAKTANEYKIL